MKLKVHRVRFVDYKPQAIHCLAFEDGTAYPRLAVSRADSSIEIWSIKDKWNQLQIIPGCKGSSVESLVWCGKRLFSAGLHGEITEWDLARLAPKVSLDSFGGAVWSLAISHSKNTLAAGCEDGCTRLFDITEDGLQFRKSLDSQEGRILSLNWHISDNFLVTGSSDSTAKLYSVAHGRCTLRITMEEFEKRSTLIWSILITSDFTIITGDSLGNTQFWDGKQGTLLQSYAAHKADVLCLSINQKEDTVFSSGVDSKIVQFRLTPKENQGKRWMKSNASRAHSHDVRALTLLEPKDMLVSGGHDTRIGVYSLSHFGTEDGNLILPFPQVSRVHLASKANILMYQQQASLEFWRLGETDATVITKAPVRLLQLSAKGDNHILCSAVSPCAKWVAFSNIHQIRVFRTNFDNEDSSKVSVKKVYPLPPRLLPAQCLEFTQDGQSLVSATSDHSVQVLALGDEPALLSTLRLPDEQQSISSMRLFTVSEDGRWAACVNSRNRVNVFDLVHQKHHCRLPSYPAAVTAVAFQPKTHSLVLVCADLRVYMYNTESSKLTDWSKKVADHGLPSQWVNEVNKVVMVTFSPDSHDTMVLCGQKIFAVIDLQQPLPDKDLVFLQKPTREKKRKRDRADTGIESYDSTPKKKAVELKGITETQNATAECGTEKDTASSGFKVCAKYKPILFMGFNSDNSLVVVERPWVNISEALPPPLYRKRYGR